MSSTNTKIWQILDKFSEEFKDNFPDYSELILQLLWNRNLKEKEEIEKFLNPKYEDLYDPFLFRDMEEAVELVIKHIKEQNKIFVYGDYDADGVTSAAVLVEVLGILKADVDVYIPHRVTEGYGLNEKALRYIAEQGVKLIITVDTGIRNKEEIALAKELGIDVVLTDHHPAAEDKNDLPETLIIDPITPGETYPFKKLSGAGVAFKLAIAIIGESKLNDLDKKKLEHQLLDIIAIGTVADVVSLKDENRTLVKEGLKVLGKTKRPGLKELKEVANIKNNNKPLNSWNIGFQLAPRLNAAGRMGNANTAYELLVTKDKKEAVTLARRLNNRNMDRQKITEEIATEVEKQINSEEPGEIIIGIAPEEKEAWNEGVVGLVAGRIASKYYRPTLIITKAEKSYKGSGRSIAEFNLARAVEQCSEVLEKYGGHPMACGFSLKEENLDKFKDKITKIAEQELGGKDLKPKITVDYELKLEEISNELIDEINLFEPFGQENNKPVFASYGAKVLDIMLMGMDGQHIKLRLKGESSNVLTAIGFSQAERWQDLTIGDIVDIAYYLEINEFNGRREAQMKIVDIRIINII